MNRGPVVEIDANALLPGRVTRFTHEELGAHFALLLSALRFPL